MRRRVSRIAKTVDTRTFVSPAVRMTIFPIWGAAARRRIAERSDEKILRNGDCTTPFVSRAFAFSTFRGIVWIFVWFRP